MPNELTERCAIGIRLYLLGYRFPNFDRHVQIPELLSTSCTARFDVGADSERGLVFSFWAEIQRLPIDKCNAQCEVLRAEARRMMELELQASFYLFEGMRRPDAPVDYPIWAKMAYWTIDEATTLFLARDPDWINWAAVEPHVKSCAFAERFRVIRQLLTRAQQVKQLECEMRPADVVAWAQRNRIELPPELVTAIAALPVQRITKPTEGEQLNPKKETSLLKMVYCIAVHLGYRRGQPNPAARKISELSQLAGEFVHEDTARKYIREAEAAGCGAERSA